MIAYQIIWLRWAVILAEMSLQAGFMQLCKWLVGSLGESWCESKMQTASQVLSQCECSAFHREAYAAASFGKYPSG
jgi:hypothetical protein